MDHSKRLSATTIAFIEIITVLLAMAGLFMVGVGGSNAYEAYSSQYWPTTSGEIVTSRVETFLNGVGERSYNSKIEYIYQVVQEGSNEEYFEGTRLKVDPIPSSNDRAGPEVRVNQFPKGKIVEVYYNPERPEKSILQPGFSLSKLTYPTAGLLVLILALFLRVVRKRALT